MILSEHRPWSYNLFKSDTLLDGCSSLGAQTCVLQNIAPLVKCVVALAILWRDYLHAFPVTSITAIYVPLCNSHTMMGVHLPSCPSSSL